MLEYTHWHPWILASSSSGPAVSTHNTFVRGRAICKIVYLSSKSVQLSDQQVSEPG